VIFEEFPVEDIFCIFQWIGLESKLSDSSEDLVPELVIPPFRGYIGL